MSRLTVEEAHVLDWVRRYCASPSGQVIPYMPSQGFEPVCKSLEAKGLLKRVNVAHHSFDCYIPGETCLT